MNNPDPHAGQGGMPPSPPQGARAPRRSWWRHLLTHDAADAFEIFEGTNVLFGRHESCDIRVTSRKASRQHAELQWQGSQAMLVDLGSNNGCFVNDQRIAEPTPLKDGDEIRIASYISIYRKVHSDDELEDDENSGAMTTAGIATIFSGRLEDKPVVEVLTSLAGDTATGVLNILPKQGSIGISSGLPMWAEAGGLQGEEAILAILKLRSGMFVFAPQYEDRPQTCRRSFAQIISDALSTAPASPSGGVPRPKAPTGRIPPAPPPGTRRMGALPGRPPSGTRRVEAQPGRPGEAGAPRSPQTPPVAPPMPARPRVTGRQAPVSRPGPGPRQPSPNSGAPGPGAPGQGQAGQGQAGQGQGPRGSATPPRRPPPSPRSSGSGRLPGATGPEGAGAPQPPPSPGTNRRPPPQPPRRPPPPQP